MAKKQVRAGIVGAGFAAKFHYEGLRKVYSADVEVAGVFTIDTKQGKEYARERGIKAFGSLEELIEEADVVHVCVPPAVHESIAVAALKKDKYAVVEKPLTGFFGDGREDFNGWDFSKEKAREGALASVRRMLEAERGSKGRILYAENWIYAPSIQKEREIIEKTGGQILWMRGEESHSGSHAVFYGYWKYSGGGVMMTKGCHPLTAALYLKRVEGRARDKKPIRPKTVSARVHAITRLGGFRDEGHIRRDYHDIDDLSLMHVTFEDGTAADIIASDIILGGIHNELEVACNNHRTICNINPNNAMVTYNPVEKNFEDIYVVEKTGTKQGWSNPSPDEDWFTGYHQEIEAFYRSVALGEAVETDSSLAADCISTIYSAYMSVERKGAEVVIELV